MEQLIKKLRRKLIIDGHSLKYWHKNYASKICKYNYFIRQINTIDCIRPDLVDAIKKWIKA
jgi:hypothetical protein